MDFSTVSLEYLFALNCRAHHIYADKAFEKLHLYRGQVAVLIELGKKDGMTHSELAGKIRVTPATITTMLKRMEQSGLILRQRDKQDERVSRVFLTDKGRSLSGSAYNCSLEIDQAAFTGFSDEEKQQMRELFIKMLTNLTRDTETD